MKYSSLGKPQHPLPPWAHTLKGKKSLRVLLVSLFSKRYPSLGESHGLSVIAGSLHSETTVGSEVQIVDLVGTGSEDCTPIRNKIMEWSPHVLGIGLQYGTFSILEREYMDLKKHLHSSSIIVFGGPLATYIPELLLERIEPRAFVVIGEGDEAFPSLLQQLAEPDNLGDVPNLAYRQDDGEELLQTPRALVEPENVPQPYRKHIPSLAARGAQIFSESSRACSWAACSFCLRGLTDIRGRGEEYRRLPIKRLESDLNVLTESGIRSLTFADEDFLGGDMAETEAFVAELSAVLNNLPALTFDVSATVHSIANARDLNGEAVKKRQLLTQLRSIGLRKVFLGIESGSPAQLRRYAKGHSPAEAELAARTVLEAGASLEIGWIMFDPLCEMSEIRENLEFLKTNGLAPFVSSLSSELRVQSHSRYLNLLNVYEKRTGKKLYDPTLDPDTLQYNTYYAYPDVRKLAREVKLADRRMRSLAYPLKSLSRFGPSGALGQAADEVREALAQFRSGLCDALLGSLSSDSGAYRKGAELALSRLARGFLSAYRYDTRQLPGPLVADALQVARSIVNER